MRPLENAITVAALGWACTLTTPASAQTLYGVDSTLGEVLEVAGPSSAIVCGYPDGGLREKWSYQVAALCAGGPMPATVAAGSLAGDVAVDRQTDTIYVTDGKTVAAYTPRGTLVEHFDATVFGLLGDVTGLGWDGTNNQLWMCDGARYVAVNPFGNCSPLQVFPTTPKPPVFGTLTDITHEPVTNTLWASDDTGLVANFFPGAAGVVNALNVAGPVPGCGGALNAPLTGIAWDTSATSPQFFVTDGATIAHLEVLGAGAFGQAPPSLAYNASCWTTPAGTLNGLSCSARPITYGTGSGPTIDAVGQAAMPNPTFRVRMRNADPGIAWLMFGFIEACPAGTIKTQPKLLAAVNAAFGPVAHSGNVSLPVPLPAAGLPAGLNVRMQWISTDLAGNWQTSNGLALTTARP